MSISGALTNALSGLTAAARSADIAASNISNSMTEGYGVREVVLSSRVGGDSGGVNVSGIIRHEDKTLLADRRSADATVGNATVKNEFYTSLQSELGLPNVAGSLTDLISELEASLTLATQAPESEPQLARIQEDLVRVPDHLNSTSDAIQDLRVRADQKIDAAVETLNTNLQALEDINYKIRRHVVLGHDVSAMLDQRQKLVDEISEIVPVKELDRGNGLIALMTADGTMLVDGPAAEISFTPTPVITPDMTLASGALSALEVNGVPLDHTKTPNPIQGGVLAAHFTVRDSLAIDAQTNLDAFARDLIERFEDPAADPTLVAGNPGLFTDNGVLFDPLNEVGIAGRIEINPLVDPSSGGALWRIRDGLGAAAQGPSGDSSGLIALSEALTNVRAPVSGNFFGGARSASALASDVVSIVSGSLERSETTIVFAAAQQSALTELELQNGVDTDYEMQRLLLIEQAYAANARVIEVIDSMLDALMRI